MEMALVHDEILMRNMDSDQYEKLRNLGKCKWDRQKKLLIGPADLELMEALKNIVKLPPRIEAERVRLQNIQNAIDTIRMEEEHKAIVKCPVKAKLFAHQQKAVDMALIVFEAIEPKAGENDE